MIKIQYRKPRDNRRVTILDKSNLPHVYKFTTTKTRSQSCSTAKAPRTRKSKDDPNFELARLKIDRVTARTCAYLTEVMITGVLSRIRRKMRYVKSLRTMKKYLGRNHVRQ